LDTQEPVVVGRIVGAWGVHGEVKVEPFTDFPSRFNKGSILFLHERPLRVSASRKRKNGFVLKLESVDDRSDAEALRGSEMTVPVTDLEDLPVGTFYYFQIIGLEVWTEESELLGTVREIITTGANDAYVVSDGNNKPVLVPAIGGVVQEVDVSNGKMVVKLPIGLR
tara:strand:+ start:291 stop:791 length:501 start_codon:yes stop_codon:yes gene_type:complete